MIGIPIGVSLGLVLDPFPREIPVTFWSKHDQNVNVESMWTTNCNSIGFGTQNGPPISIGGVLFGLLNPIGIA